MAQSPSLRLRELLYPSNILTILRLLLLPPTVYLAARPKRERAALICLASAMLTDLIDGPIARRRGEVSQLGQLLDPIADKLLVDAFAVVLTIRRRFPWWASGLLLIRDLIILTGGITVYRRQGIIMTANTSGKVMTVAITVTLLAYAAGGERFGRFVLYMALLPYAASAITYSRALARQLRTGPPA